MVDWANELDWIVGIGIVVGLVGVVVQVLPGALLVGGSVLAWGLITRGTVGWTVAGIALVVTAAAQVVRALVAGRYLERGGVPGSTLAWGALAGVIGFVVIPVVGLFLGFPLGVYVAERVRLREHRAAWASTVRAMKATGLAIVVELFGALVVAVAWVAGLLLR